MTCASSQLFFCTDTNDFNATAFNVTFPADEVMNIADVLRLIRIVDDEIDEAQEQVFIIFLEVLEAVNFDLITITRSTSFGRIIDNDGEPLSALIMFNNTFSFLLLAIQIGFALAEYSFDEPEFEIVVTDIVLVREGGRLSEQTFQVAISVGGTIDTPPATPSFVDELRGDYSIGPGRDFVALTFRPFEQNITFPLVFFSDGVPEGTEAFRATSSPSPDYPNFGAPSMGGAFASTDVFIADDDCKLEAVNVQHHAIMLVSCL